MNELPAEKVTSQKRPANNGETQLQLSDQGRTDTGGAIPWEVGSDELLDPVTTESESSRWRSLPQGKSIDAIRRRPFASMLDIPSYVSGYVDGEGCFCISLRPQSRIKVGWEVRPSFSVSQNDDRAELIKLLPHLFGGGSIRPDRSDKTLKFEIRSLALLLESVIPFFQMWPLLTSKRKDFEIFSVVCGSMATGAHRTKQGVLEIAELVQEMNPSGSRRYTTEMIRASFAKVKG